MKRYLVILPLIIFLWAGMATAGFQDVSDPAALGKRRYISDAQGITLFEDKQIVGVTPTFAQEIFYSKPFDVSHMEQEFSFVLTVDYVTGTVGFDNIDLTGSYVTLTYQIDDISETWHTPSTHQDESGNHIASNVIWATNVTGTTVRRITPSSWIKAPRIRFVTYATPTIQFDLKIFGR